MISYHRNLNISRNSSFYEELRFLRVSNEKCKKAAKTKGLSLLKTFGISGFSYVANATTEPAG
nr:MAG TPA: hypothetical protein [Caudoviricetes sp.]